MKQHGSIAAMILLAAATLPAFAASQYPITQAQIAAAVTADGLQVSADGVSPLANVVASVAHPRLQVKSVQSAGDRRVIARVECADTAQCLPFFVAVNLANGDSLAAQEQGGSVSKSEPILARSGAPATLQLEGTHIHVTLPVVCLENGKLGQTIRVASPDRRQFYTAQVVGDRLLRGRL